MKKVVVSVMLAAMAIMVMAGIAYADSGDSTYLTTAGSPHGGYTTTSKKCGVCHAVHHAWAGEVLLKSTAASGCTYCHIQTSTGNVQIYDAVISNYSGGDIKNAHNSGASPCINCHQVHAADSAMTTNVYLTAKILKLAGDYTGSYEATPSSADVGDDDLAVTKWCTGCHSYYNTDYDGSSHVMTAATDDHGAVSSGTYAGRVSTLDSTYCRSCHDSGLTGTAPTSTIITNSFPHYTVGERFLDNVGSVETTDSEYDGVCLKCHQWSSSTEGVGIDF